MTAETKIITDKKFKLPVHGWIGFSLITLFWTFNWALTGARTNWAFFQLIVGWFGEKNSDYIKVMHE